MAGGGDLRSPYETALGVGLWGWRQRHVIRGRIVLAGGRPDRLSLRDFMDASFALAGEEHQRINPFMDLLSAAEKIEGSSQVEQQNTASLNMLDQMMRGVQKRR